MTDIQTPSLLGITASSAPQSSAKRTRNDLIHDEVKAIASMVQTDEDIAKFSEKFDVRLVNGKFVGADAIRNDRDLLLLEAHMIQEDGKTKKRKLSKRHPRNLPESSTGILRDWMLSPQHFDYPYPNDLEKSYLEQVADISSRQLTNWFTNARKRVWTPLRHARGEPIIDYNKDRLRHREKRNARSHVQPPTAPAWSSKKSISPVQSEASSRSSVYSSGASVAESSPVLVSTQRTAQLRAVTRPTHVWKHMPEGGQAAAQKINASKWAFTVPHEEMSAAAPSASVSPPDLMLTESAFAWEEHEQRPRFGSDESLHSTGAVDLMTASASANAQASPGLVNTSRSAARITNPVIGSSAGAFAVDSVDDSRAINIELEAKAEPVMQHAFARTTGPATQSSAQSFADNACLHTDAVEAHHDDIFLGFDPHFEFSGSPLTLMDAWPMEPAPSVHSAWQEPTLGGTLDSDCFAGLKFDFN